MDSSGAARAKLPWFKFLATDWISDLSVMTMSSRQRGWYIQLLAYCWQEGGLPNDNYSLQTLSGFTKDWLWVHFEASNPDNEKDWGLVLDEEWKSVISHFELIEGRMFHPKLYEQYVEAKGVNASRVAAANKTNANRVANRDGDRSGDRSGKRSLRASESESYSGSYFGSDSKENKVADSFLVFWERYRKLRDAGRMQITAQMWLSFGCEEHAAEILACLSNYEASRDVASGAVQNGDLWLRTVRDSGWTATWPAVATKKTRLQGIMDSL